MKGCFDIVFPAETARF